MSSSERYRPSRAALELGDAFYDPVLPARFPERILRFRNDRWAARVGLEELSNADWEAHFARFSPLPGSLERPLALRYHGHQFQSYNPDLGDGRGFLFAQLHDAEDGRLLDLGTKGSGRTPYSRGGDGKLTLKGGFREVLATEMLEALGVSTSKSFSLFETGERLSRNDEPSPTRSSVLVRLSHSHVRFGTFQRLLYHRDAEGMRRLVEYCVRHLHPDLGDAPDPATALFERVVERAAALVASWMAAGFVHGVLNTDNMSITGESFDYGPWRFLPHYDPGFTAAYFDGGGLYAFGRQPDAVMWNLARLAECLRLATPERRFEALLERFPERFRAAFRPRLLARLGLRPVDEATDQRLVDVLFRFLDASRVGFAQFFFDWYGGEASRARAKESPARAVYETERFAPVLRELSLHEPAHEEKLSLDYFRRTRPCDMRIDEVEALWSEIAEVDDWSSFEWKVRDIRAMGDALGLRATSPTSTESPTSATVSPASSA